MPNVKYIVSSHNYKIIYSQRSIRTKTCNCITKTACPLNKQCLLRNIVYQAIVSSVNPELKEDTIKAKYANHLKSLNTVRYKNNTELRRKFGISKKKSLHL